MVFLRHFLSIFLLGNMLVLFAISSRLSIRHLQLLEQLEAPLRRKETVKDFKNIENN